MGSIGPETYIQVAPEALAKHEGSPAPLSYDMPELFADNIAAKLIRTAAKHLQDGNVRTHVHCQIQAKFEVNPSEPPDEVPSPRASKGSKRWQL